MDLVTAPKKVQTEAPFSHLGHLILQRYTVPKMVEIQVRYLATLNEFQTAFGDINWLCPALKLTIHELSPLFDIVKGDSAPNSKRTLTPEAKTSLSKVNQALLMLSFL